MTEPGGPGEEEGETRSVRERILAVAAELIADGGREAVTTRAVGAAAGVNAPTIYRLFGAKQGLLDAVAQHGLAAYVAEKSAREPHDDPVQELRIGWDTHIAFGLTHPALFAIIAGDPRTRPRSAAGAAGLELLQRRVKNIAVAGRLRVTEARAVVLLESVATGTVLTLLGQPRERRDLALSEFAREMVIAALTGETGPGAEPGPLTAAVALRACLNQVPNLSGGERHLLEELLDRIANRD